MKIVNAIALLVLIIGGLNWGLVGLFDFDLVATLFGGSESVFSEIVYTLVGIAAIYSFFLLKPVTTDNSHAHSVHHA